MAKVDPHELHCAAVHLKRPVSNEKEQGEKSLKL